MPRPSIPFGQTPTAFEEFWAAWSKRRNKGDALKAWLTLNPSPELASRIVAAAKEQDSWPEFSREGRQYQPYPATWLRAWGWENEKTDVSARQLTSVNSRTLEAAANWGRK